MAIWYLDPQDGDNSVTATPYGWWSVVVTVTGGTMPVAGETMTSALGKTAILTRTPSSWVGAVTCYFYGKSGIFAAGNVSFTGSGTGTIAADLTYCAWKGLTGGATAGRTTAGDIIRMKKSPNHVLVCNATWNNLSKVITLDTAQTLTVDRCEIAWTPVHGSVIRQPVATDAKEGSYCMQITEDAVPGANEVQAYYPTGLLDLHLFQKLSFWIKNEAAVLANQWIIKLYTTVDASGVACDEFAIPAIPSTGQWLPLTVARTTGGNLNATVRSIALVNGASLPTLSKYIRLDNIQACYTDGLNLQSVISKSSIATSVATEAFYGIQSIVGTAILLDIDTNCLATAGRGYYGVTENAPTYRVELLKTVLASSLSGTCGNSTQRVGTAGAFFYLEGGYDPITNIRDGQTWTDGLNGYGVCWDISMNYWNVSRIGGWRYGEAVYISGNNPYIGPDVMIASDITGGNCSSAVVDIFSNSVLITGIKATNSGYNTSYGGIYIGSGGGGNGEEISIDWTNNNRGPGIANSGGRGIFTVLAAHNNGTRGIELRNENILKKATCYNNGTFGIYFAGGNCRVYDLVTSGNVSGAIGQGTQSGVKNTVYRGNCSEATKIGGGGGIGIECLLHNYDQINHVIVWDGGNILAQQTVRHSASGVAYAFYPLSTRTKYSPLCLPIAKIAVAAGTLVTVTAWMMKSVAATVGGKIVVRGGQILNVDTDAYAEKANDLNWEQLSFTFTPGEAGVVEVEAQAWYISAANIVYVHDVSVVQV